MKNMILILALFTTSCATGPDFFSVAQPSPWVEWRLEGNFLTGRLRNGTLIRLGTTLSGEIQYQAGTDLSLPSISKLWQKREAGPAPRPLSGQNQDTQWSFGGLEVHLVPGGMEVFHERRLAGRWVWMGDTSGTFEWLKGPEQDLWFGIGGTVQHDPELSGKSFQFRHYAHYGNQTNLFIPFVFSRSGLSLYNNVFTMDSIEFAPRGLAQRKLSTTHPQIQGFIGVQPDLRKNLETFYQQSGSQSLLPRWAYGYLQSKYGYRSNQEIYDLVKGFEDRNLPLSAVILDLYWFKRMGDFDWDAQNWDSKALDRFLESRNIKTLAITEPYVSRDAKRYQELKDKELLVTDASGSVLEWSSWWALGGPPGSMINLRGPEASTVLGTYYRHMIETGIDGFWTDLGEPEENPETAVFGEFKGEEYHNYYNLEWSRVVHDTWKTVKGPEPVLILSRSGYTGSAGLGVSTWSGDVGTSFGALSKHVGLGLAAAFTGLPYWGSDVGGFRGATEKELFVRWHQFGAFSPVYRPHGSKAPREPWTFPGEAEELISDMIRLRFRLLPYTYATAWQTFQRGTPMMRPLFWEENRAEFWEEWNAYLWGDSFYVRPVTRSQKTLPVFTYTLPTGTWYNWWTGEKTNGGTLREETNQLNRFPLYLREGALVPTDEKGRPGLIVAAFSGPGTSQMELPRNHRGEGSTFRLDSESLTVENWTEGSLLLEIWTPEGITKQEWNPTQEKSVFYFQKDRKI